MNLQEEIAKVAYELYEKSGRAIGKDMENWLEAEKIVKARTKKELTTAAKQMEQVAEAAGKKVKEAVKKTVTSLKTAAKRDLKKS